MKLPLTIAACVGLLATIIATPALADCSQDSVVPAYAYSYVVAMPEAEAPFRECEYAAEAVECDGTLPGCGRAMQRAYVSCVAREVCDSWAEGASEDGTVVGLEPLAEAYEGCLALVVAAGGEY